MLILKRAIIVTE